MRQSGVAGFWLAIVPHLDVPVLAQASSLWVLMFFIEVAGLLIRHIVLAVRCSPTCSLGTWFSAVVLWLYLDGLVIGRILS